MPPVPPVLPHMAVPTVTVTVCVVAALQVIVTFDVAPHCFTTLHDSSPESEKLLLSVEVISATDPLGIVNAIVLVSTVKDSTDVLVPTV